MDCNHARLLMTFARDHAALDPDEADSLEEHLNQCPECAPLAAGERRLDVALRRAMRDVPVPAGLRARLLARLPRPRRIRRWILSSAAAAAVLLLAAGVSWRLWFAPRPEIAFDDVPMHVCRNPQVSAQDVERWFEDRGLTMAFPPRLDAQKLDSISITFFQGQRVPKLEFLIDGHIAHVYVLSDQLFQVNEDTKPPSHVATTASQSMRTFIDNGYLYLVVYTGAGLPTFQ